MDSITEIIFLPLPLLCIIGSINRFIWQKPSRSSADGGQTAEDEVNGHEQHAYWLPERICSANGYWRLPDTFTR